MKKERLTYLLLPFVIIVWSLIAYRYFSYNNSEEIEQPEIFNTSFKPAKEIKIDTFSISFPDRDPFLGTITNVNKKVKIKVKNSSKKDTIFPNINYHGLLKKQQSNDQFFVLSINNKQHLIKKGQRIDNVYLISGDNQKVLVKSNGRTKSIVKQ